MEIVHVPSQLEGRDRGRIMLTPGEKMINNIDKIKFI